MMKNAVEKKISLTREQRLGMGILCSLAFVSWAAISLLHRYRKSRTRPRQPLDRRIVQKTPSQAKKMSPARANNRVSDDKMLDINRAAPADWIKFRGIGPVLSSRITEFRQALGGFSNIDQIREVSGMPVMVFNRIRHQLNINTKSLKKLNINAATMDEMKSHPYIDDRLAAAIKAFRAEHGLFQSAAALKQLQLVDDEIYRKIVPYLSLK